MDWPHSVCGLAIVHRGPYRPRPSMPPLLDPPEKSLPPPWDRIFSLATRTFVWCLLIAVIYVLRPFFLLIFLTFVFAYIQAHGVDGLAHRIKKRPLRVTIVGLVFLGTLLATGFTLVPQVNEQAATFLRNKDKYVTDADEELHKFLVKYPSLYQAAAKHSQTLSGGNNIFSSTFPDVPPQRSGSGPSNGPVDENGHKTTESPPSTNPAGGDPQQPGTEKPGEISTPNSGTGPAGQDPPKPMPKLNLVRDFIASLAESLTKNPLELGQSVLGFASSFLLSLLFSFLIVLDLQKIKRGITGLADTKIGFIYNEVADNIAAFGRVLGRALEAQMFIAICNTILTAIGVWMMGLDNLLVLSAIVFFCSFIPVVGTIISSVPICLLALQAGGVTSLLLAILLICVIHALETYVLNPQIYGHHMHMNPVLVLIVLTIGGKLFGVWGLVLGIPIVNYVFRHAIRGPEQRPAESLPAQSLPAES